MAKKVLGNSISGAVIIDKPPGCTSHDVVDQVRRSLGTRKVGHAGTLDPDASGVLVLGVGVGTKLLQFVSGTDKDYTAEIVFGAETSTLDSSGEVTATYEMDLTADSVAAVAQGFVGEIEQVPPMVSALKVDGKRLYEIARSGQTIERQARPVKVQRFELSPTPDPLVYEAVVSCSAGTYVRSLAADLGTALGGGAYLRNLRRTRVGDFTLQQAQPLTNFSLAPISELVKSLPVLTVDEELLVKIRNGHKLGPAGGCGRFAVMGPDGTLLAIYEARNGEMRPLKVLSSNG